MKKRIELSTPSKYIINAVLVAVLLVGGTLLYNSGLLNRASKAVLIQCGIYSILAVSLNICTGYLGQLPLGHAGFMAVGAYTGALFWKATAAWPTGITILIGLVVFSLLRSFVYPNIMNGAVKEASYSEFLAMVDQGEVEEVDLDRDNGEITFTTGEGESRQIYKTTLFPNDATLVERLIGLLVK